jgi:hypothetical protein
MFIDEAQAATARQVTVGLWRNTNAINRIDLISPTAGNTIQAGSTFTLYGIAAA